jgi:hypothetical protein
MFNDAPRLHQILYSNIIMSLEENNIGKILLCSTQLAANYNLWENDTNVQNILDMDKNKMCMFVKKTNPILDDVTIKCIVLSFYLNFYKMMVDEIKFV